MEIVTFRMWSDPHQALDPRVVCRDCQDLGLDVSQLPDLSMRHAVTYEAPPIQE